MKRKYTMRSHKVTQTVLWWLLLCPVPCDSFRFDKRARPLRERYFMRERQLCESGDSRDNVSSILLRLLSKPLTKQSDIYFVELDEYKREHDHTILQLSSTHWGQPHITSLQWKVLFIHKPLMGGERVWRCVLICVCVHADFHCLLLRFYLFYLFIK